MLPVLLATVVQMSPNLLFLVQLGIIHFKEMHLVQNVKLDRLVLIRVRHQNTVLLAPTVRRFVSYILYTSGILFCLSILFKPFQLKLCS